MASLSNTFEGGTNGTSVSNSNSGGGSGDVFDGVSIPASSTLTFTTTAAMNGALGMTATTTAANLAPYAQWSNIVAATRQVMAFSFKMPALPTSTTYIAVFRNATGVAATVGINDTGRLSIYNTTGAQVTATEMTNPLVVNTAYRIEMAVNPGTTTSTGSATLAYYPLASSTATQSLSTTTSNFGSAEIDKARFGRVAASAWVGSVHFDDVRVKDLASGWIGPVSAAATPPILRTTNTLRYLIDTRTSSPGAAGALTYTITQTVGPTTTPTLIVAGLWSVAQHATQSLTYGVTVSEAGGGSASGTVLVPHAALAGAELIYSGTAWI